MSFSIYFYNKFFWEQENLGGTKEILGRTAPECPPVAKDLPLIINNKSFGTRNLCGKARNSKIKLVDSCTEKYTWHFIFKVSTALKTEMAWTLFELCDKPEKRC